MELNLHTEKQEFGYLFVVLHWDVLTITDILCLSLSSSSEGGGQQYNATAWGAARPLGQASAVDLVPHEQYLCLPHPRPTVPVVTNEPVGDPGET